MRHYTSMMYAVVLCLSICQKPVLFQNSWMDGAGFQRRDCLWFILHCFGRGFRYLQNKGTSFLWLCPNLWIWLTFLPVCHSILANVVSLRRPTVLANLSHEEYHGELGKPWFVSKMTIRTRDGSGSGFMLNTMCHLIAVCLVSEASVEVYFSSLWCTGCSWDAAVAATSMPSTLHLAVPLSAWRSCCYWLATIPQPRWVLSSLVTAWYSSGGYCQCIGR